MGLDSTERNLVFDIEANNLLHNVTKVWCIYTIDKETREGFLFHDYPQFNGVEGIDDLGKPYVLPKRSGSLKEGARFLSKAKQLICHNILGYDLFLLKKFFPKFRMRYGYPEIRDTLLESQVQWFDRPPVKGYKGRHGLAPWGARLGIRKPEIPDWSYIDADKLNRCIQDVEINLLTADKLEEEREGLLNKCGISFEKALVTEHEYRYNMTIQELNGTLVDVPLAEKSLKWLDNQLEVLKKDIEPFVPPTVKYPTGKVTASEMIRKMGVTYKDFGLKKEPETRYVPKTIGGVTKDHPVKRWRSPTGDFTSNCTVNSYSIVAPSGETLEGSWTKLKEARDYVKETLGVPTRGFKYPKKVVTTTLYNSHTARHFECEPEDYGKPLGDTNWTIEGAFTKVTFQKATMSQHDTVKSYLRRLGWEPDEWTIKKDSSGKFVRIDEKYCDDFHKNNRMLVKRYNLRKSQIVVLWPNNLPIDKRCVNILDLGSLVETTPKLTEKSYESLPEGMGKNIADYYTYDHRRKYIQNPSDPTKGLLAHVREDGRVPCGMQTFGTTSGRAAHYNVVNLPSANALYGDVMRSLIKCPEGRTFVGIDMPNCHPRILSFLTGNKKFLDAIRSGAEEDADGNKLFTDFHSVNAVLFSLISEEERLQAVATQAEHLIKAFLDARKKGKGCSFTCLYGGSGNKLAQTIGGISTAEGNQRKDDFISGLGLDIILRDLEKQWKGKTHKGGSFISVLGDYHIFCNSKHKMINTMAIGSEAVLQKKAINWICKEITKQELDVKIVLSMHDEVLFEVADEDLEAFLPIGKRFYEEGAQQMGIDNDFMSVCLVGKTYYDCH